MMKWGGVIVMMKWGGGHSHDEMGRGVIVTMKWGGGSYSQ